MNYKYNKKRWTIFASITISILTISIYHYSQQSNPIEEINTKISADKSNNHSLIEKKSFSKKRTQIAEPPASTNTENKKNTSPQWMKHTPEFKTFLSFREKAIKTQAEIDEFKQLINSYEMVKQCEIFLLNDALSGKELDLTEERARLNSVNYLSSLITGKYSSSQLAYAVEIANKVISTPIPASINNTAVIRSLLGDKIELGIDMYLYQHDAWDKIKNHTMDEKQIKLFKYIEKAAKSKAVNLKNNIKTISDRLRENSDKNYK